MIFDNAEVYGYATVYQNARIFGNAIVCGDAKVYDNVEVFGDSKIFGDAILKNNSDYVVFKNFWSSGRYFTWTRSNNMWKVGCFYGSGDELIKKAYKNSELNGKMYKYVVNSIQEGLKIYDNYKTQEITENVE